ncbi:receptor-like protein kinase ANXUR1 [Euphorbia lathyris]|uniref:receptor-like protein kinase ANXUR1 n=1 Tax=Euphorbia lathyris TaxID=212925 RepID=UPI003313A9C1
MNIFNANISPFFLLYSIAFVAFYEASTARELKVFRVNCGSGFEEKDADGHKWEPDARYLHGNFSKARSSHQDSSIVSDIPYMDARIFHSKGTYKFPVMQQIRYFIRLYFYPSEYNHLNISHSYFTVQAAGVTLLRNFSAWTAAQAHGRSFVIKEYSLAPLNTDTLSVSFKPLRGANDSFAFVNGIELVPITGQLFGMGPEVGRRDMHMINTNATNLETMYRLNIGGQFIPPKKDSGNLGRAWFNDDPFLHGTSMGISLQADGRVPIKYNQIPKFMAPVDVYSTSRTMGEHSMDNLLFNLTWVFEVDANFTYMIRFHFCDFILTRPNQITFNIYINNQTAQCDPHPADVIAWAGKPGEPVYKDYMITLEDGTDQGKHYIQVDLHPSIRNDPQFYDAQISGLEIFKINDDDQSLAGLNPDLSAADPTGANHAGFVISERELVVGGTAGVFLAAALFLVVSKRKAVELSSASNPNLQPIYGSSHVINTSSRRSTVSGSSSKHSKAQSLCRRFTLAEIKHATKNFKEGNIIGVGGFGNVYKGYIDEHEKVAIKRSNPQSEQGIDEFDTEIEMLSHLRHKHLVSLIGFCEEENERCLVYDYMSNGTLSDFLHKPKGKTKLSWSKRLDICIGAARGLHYLHTGATHTIIHRDVKTTNILLDEHLIAKVSDFGLSKISCPTKEKGHVSTMVKGSFGYLDPEYFKKRRLTEKSDVYSFGVVLFESLCRRPAVDNSLPLQQMNLAEWSLRCQRNGNLEDNIDPEIKETINPECLKKFIETALKCLSEEGNRRPAMSDVLWNLEYALQLQEVPDSSEFSVTRTISAHGDPDQQLNF